MSGEVQHPLLLVLSAAASIPLYRTWASLLFGSWQKAPASVRWVFVRDTKPFERGDYVDDKFAEIRLIVLLVLCGVTIWAVYAGVSHVAHWLGA